MKYRNGFISNSSSASFLIAFPPHTPIALAHIESWLGGYTKEIAPEIMDAIGFQFWKTQYFDEDMNRRDFKGTEKEYDFHKCTATWNQMSREVWGCPRLMSKDSNGSPTDSICQACKYHIVEKRIDRGDDYYYALDSCYENEAKAWLERHKEDKIIYFEVDDNNPARGLDYNTAREITSNAHILFDQKKGDKYLGRYFEDNVYCLGGK